MGFLRSQMWKVLEWKDDSTDTIVYRFPMDGKEIMSGSQLTVRESQVAIFVHLGKIADVFTPGKYKLTTKNLPILSGIGSVFYQGESRFKAELYFVNTKQFLDCKWGTVNPVAMRDKDFGAIRIRAFGNYSYRVTDAELFMKEVFGTRGLVKREDIEDNFKNLLISQMSDTIAESKISALDMAMNYQEFGEMILSNAKEKFSALGLDITAFNVINISFPESVEKALDERTGLGILGDSMGLYTQKRAAEALGEAAKNGSGANTIIGMGLGNMTANIVGASMSGQQSNQGVKVRCSKCNALVAETAKFCPECGNKVANNQTTSCPSCNAQIPQGTKFCPECGAKIVSNQVCPKCGVKVEGNTKFCPECGEKLN